MNISLEVSYKSLCKHGEELCGDKLELIKTETSDIIILSDGMGSGVKANILATLTSKILGTMLREGAKIEDCVDTIAKTLPVCSVRRVAYSTFSILQIFNDGRAYLVEYDNPACVFIRDKKLQNINYTVKNIEGKSIREYRFNVELGDYFVMFSDGVVHAGVGNMLSFGWGRQGAAEYIRKACIDDVSAPRLVSMLCRTCSDLYMGSPGDDTTVSVARIVKRRNVNIFTGPPTSYDDDAVLMRDFMTTPGTKIVSGGTSANIAARILNKKIIASLNYTDPEIPPIATLEGIDLVTEGVFTLNRCADMLEQYNKGDISERFFDSLDADNGAAMLAKILVEECTHLNMFVGQAMNAAHQNVGLPFDLSIRMRLVEKIKTECEKMGKAVNVKYY